jgi:integrase
MATITWRGKNNATAQLNWSEEGNQHRVSIGTVTTREAETIRLEKELEIRTGKSSTLSAPGFQDFAIDYLNWHKFEYPASHNRIYQITHDYLITHFKNDPLDQINPLQLETYKHSRNAKTETINKELRTLNAILNKAVEWQAIYANPITKLPTLKVTDSKPPRYYTKIELDQIYAAAPYNWHVWRFMANTGLRRGEMLNLQWDHIKDGTILVISTEQDRTKSGKWRPVPMSAGANQALERFTRDNNKKKGKLITETPPSLSRAFSRVLNRSSIIKPHGSLHSLRHTFCSHLVMDGVDLTTVQKLAGHSTIKVTEQYSHLAPDHLKQSTQLLNL